MKSLRELIDFSSEKYKQRKYEEFENLIPDWKKVNEAAFKNRTLFVNHRGEDFYHELETWSKSKISKWYDDVIQEMLKSPNSREFVKAIRKKVGDDVDADYTEDYDVAGFIRIRIYNLEKHLDNILEICKFFRYYISDIVDNIVLFEPILTQEVTKEIKNEYGNKVYHLTSKGNLASVLKNGLIVSGMSGKGIDDPILYMSCDDIRSSKLNNVGDTLRKRIQKHIQYRLFPDRCFVYYTKIDPVDAAKIVVDTTGGSLRDKKIIEFDLGRHNIPFFRDRAMREHEGVKYAYSNIDLPPKLISNTITI